MRTKELEGTHQEGPPWKIVGKFSTFEAADAKRIELSEDLDFQVKIHYQGTENNRYFALKTRANPAIALEEALNVKRAEKKRRKARLNKKRRKK
ncbi:hypothetical protein CMI37_36025 [Candidatus Pacearchaeota archaeon]|nr:hypothetical protein [Candidatus Pacearchaeota archaeon]|tara:strand:- start:1236 stop:1517 length:282 start_codon:yes stop_codon:yes gene_type:complete